MTKLRPVQIDEFTGKWSFLSNFDPSPIEQTMSMSNVRITYPTLEHAFQANKSMSVKDRQRIANAPSPNAAKKLGRSLPLREDWDFVKFRTMEGLLGLKFGQNPELGQRLVEETGNAILIEGNYWHDQIWGSCTCATHALEPGGNALGILLMYHRMLIARPAEYLEITRGN